MHQSIVYRNIPGCQLSADERLGIAHGALFGEVSASFAMKRGVAGIVVDGPVRDTDELRRTQCPVWSTCVSPPHPEKLRSGSVNVPISCGGVFVRPGDIIVAAGDAVIALRPNDLEAVLAAAGVRQAREVEYRRWKGKGEHICDVVGMRAAPASEEVSYRDGVWVG
jgi:4-hydroxy-4-methyl-2-oxoglutarate aldolase